MSCNTRVPVPNKRFVAPAPIRAVPTSPVNSTWADVQDFEEKKVVQRPLRVPVPKHLLTNARSMRGRSTNPVGRSGRGRFRQPKGWRDYNLGNAADVGMKAWNLAKHIATLINVEEKVFDVDGSGGTTITSTPTVINLSNVTQGSDYDERIGDSILCQSLEFRARLSGNPATNGNVARILIVSDRLQTGTDPVIGDVLQAGTSPLVQPYNEPKDGRFDVLYDELVSLPTAGAGLSTSGTSTSYTISRVVLPSMMRKWNKHIKYQGAAGADAANWIGGLYLMAVSADATDGPNLSYSFRIRFTDN